MLAPMARNTDRIRNKSPVDIESQCQAFLSKDTLAPPENRKHRRRIYYLSRVFWCFIWQVLHKQYSCRAVVRQLQAFCETERRKIAPSTSAYCQARERLPVAFFQRALTDSARCADRFADGYRSAWPRPVKVVDATSVRLPDTDQNRKQYPYPSGQRPGCGFPVMQVCALFSLASGAILKVVQSPWSDHDAPLFKTLWPELKAGDVVLGDRAYGSYATLALLPLRGVDVITRLHQRRRFKPREGKRIGKDQWLVSWRKPPKRPHYFTPEEWATVPDTLTVRILHIRIAQKGFRTREVWLTTTLLDPIVYPAETIAEHYLRRWDLELCFRDLKTTMGMEELRCRTPAMATKELLAFLVAHNFIRCLIAQAASDYRICRTRISFKGAIDTARSFHQAMRVARSQRQVNRLRRRLLEILAQDLVPRRPNRIEPRAVKRRPKPYPRLTKPRHLYREIPHRGKRKQKKPGRKSCLS